MADTPKDKKSAPLKKLATEDRSRQHPSMLGIGAAAGGVAGAGAGFAVGGPVGAVMGAAAGSLAGVTAGHKIAEKEEPDGKQPHQPASAK